MNESKILKLIIAFEIAVREDEMAGAGHPSEYNIKAMNLIKTKTALIKAIKLLKIDPRRRARKDNS